MAFSGSFPSEIWAEVLVHAVGPGATLPMEATDAQRVALRRLRLSTVLVCRDWKRAAQKWIYADPAFSSVPSLTSFFSSLHRGDAAWDNLRRSPHSTPGAYVHSLDLSALPLSHPSDPWIVNNLLCAILPLIPYLTRLSLPVAGGALFGGGPFLRALKASECAGTLKELHGLGLLMNGLVDGEGRDPVVALLQELKSLEALGIVGPGAVDQLTDDVTPESHPQPTLELDHLRHLYLKGVHSGLLLHALAAAPLPSITTLSLTSYGGSVGDLTYSLIEIHGSKLRSLSYLPLPDFPRPNLPLPGDTLVLCPDLTTLSISLPSTIAPPPPSFFDISSFPASPSSIVPRSARLVHLVLPRPSPSHSNASEQIVSVLARISTLQTVTIQNFTWVPFTPNSSPAALNSGLNGTIRRWAVALGRTGIQIKDAKGKGCPGLVNVNGKWALEVHSKLVRGLRRKSIRSFDDSEESEGGG